MTEQQLAAMRQALEALQKIYIAPEHEEYIRVWWPACEEAITALRTAIEQAETAHGQEPVAWMDREGDVYKKEPPENWCPPHTPLYTTPPAAQPTTRHATREEKIVNPGVYEVLDTETRYKDVIEGVRKVWEEHRVKRAEEAFESAKQREWVGLTNEELIDLTAIYSGAPLYCAIEQRLKEKNT